MKSSRPAAPSIPGLFAPPLAQRAQALVQEGWALHQAGQLAQALSRYEAVRKLQPRHFDALHLSGVIALQMGRPQEAIDLITQAIKVDRHHAMAYENRGAACVALQQYELALLNFNKSVALQPQAVNGYNHRGNALAKLGQLDAALADFDQALALQPAYAEAHHNRSNVLNDMGRHTDALASSQRAAELQPDSAAVRWNLGMNALRLGNFDAGWADYEARLRHWQQTSKLAPVHATPQWTGAESLQGQRILLHSEQGLGDTVQFSRYARLVQDLGAQVVLETQPSLMRLLQPALPGVELVARGEPLPPFDTHIPLLSLPGAFKTDLRNFPPPTPLRAEPERVAAWQTRLGPKQGLRVGLTWSGNPSHVDDHRRSMALQTLLPLITDDIAWLSLHKDVRDTDLPVLQAHPEIAHHGETQADFRDAAAMCELVDVVVCVDTSIAHVAASLGKPVWLLLAHHADWRWLTQRTDSPWYPSLTLYRQTKPGDWDEVLAKVKADLQQMKASLRA